MLQWFLLIPLLGSLILNLGGTEEILFPTDEHDNSTEQILLRQEIQLSSVVDLLSQIKNLLNNTNIGTGNNHVNPPKGTTQPPKEVSCNTGFSPVGSGVCLHVNFTVRQGASQQGGLNWTEARSYCTDLGTDLAYFTDADAYVQALDFIHSNNDDNANTMDIWIGGSDEAQEDTWLWVNGDPMPRGTPFWGTKIRDKKIIQEPTGKENQNCALLFYQNKYFIHDNECYGKAAPLCMSQH